MTPTEAVQALLDHANVPAGYIAVWVHRPDGSNPRLRVAIDPEYKRDRFNIPGSIGNYIVEKQEWDKPYEGEIPKYMMEKE